MYVGTREDNVAEACEIIGRELGSCATSGVSDEELARAKEHVKGRMVLGLESTGARMSRLARAILFDVPLLSLDEMLARVDAVSVDDLAELAAELYDPSGLSAACVGPDEDRFREAAGRRSARRWPPRMIRVAVAGAAGRMGETVCEAVEGADGLELAGRADPALEHRARRRARRGRRRRRLHHPRRRRSTTSRACLDAGVHAVVGTTGFDLDAAASATAEAPATARTCFVAPNFAIGAVLMMEIAAEARPHMPECEIIELHHDRKLDAPSGTAKRTAELIARRRAATSTSRSTRSACRAWSPIRR